MSNTRYAFTVQRLATILAVTILTLSLIAAFTGILLAFYYGPAAGTAYESIKQISTEIPNGWLIHSLHDVSGNGLVAIALVQIIILFLGRQLRLGWLIAWIGGILLTLLAIALGWTAMNLTWTQIGYWRLTLELQTIQAIPLIGPQLREILTGGGAIGTITIQHLYALHSYVLSLSAIVLSIIHLVGLLIQERENKQRLAFPIEREIPEQEVEHQHEQDSNSLDLQINSGFNSPSNRFKISFLQ
jgi:cytochrome b6